MGVLIMYKKLIRNVILCVSVVFFTLTIGYVSYFSAIRLKGHNSDSPVSSAAVMSDAAPASAAPTLATQEPEYYIAKLNGDLIEIYQCGGESENFKKFLYSFKVYRSGIPEEDLSNLTRGIILRSREDLASFEEDYNS